MSSERRLPSMRVARFGLVAIVVAMVGLRFFEVSFPGGLERDAYDFMLRTLVRRAPSSDRIVVIEVDDASLDDLQTSWPLPRSVWIRLLERLEAEKPAVIAFDVVFDRPGTRVGLEVAERVLELIPESDENKAVRAQIEHEVQLHDYDRRLAAAIARVGNVVLGAIGQGIQDPGHAGDPKTLAHPALAQRADTRERDVSVVTAMPSLVSTARSHGTLNVILDRDGVLRRYAYMRNIGEITAPSLALAAVFVAEPERAAAYARRVRDLDRAAPLMWFSSMADIKRLRLTDVLGGLPRGALTDKLVFIGVTASGSHELITTPLASPVPGVEIHAMAAQNLLSDRFIRSEGLVLWLALLLAAVLLGAYAMICERFRSNVVFGVTGLSIAGGYYVLVALLANSVGWMLPIVPVLLGVGLLAILETAHRLSVAQQQRRRLLEEQRLMRAKSEFLSTVAHELRTPLTSIRGSLGLLVGGAAGELPSGVANLIGVANNNTERLIRLVNDVLDFQKIDSGKLTLRKGLHDYGEVLREALEANQAYADSFGIGLELEECPEVELHLDRDRTIQVITNLVSNAVKFSAKGQTVEVSVRRTGNRLRTSVRDHGPGIPEEFRARIFHRFSQAKGTVAKGSGLGLNIARSIVEQHGGAIGFDTEIDVGTTFWFELPTDSEAATSATT